MIYAVLADGGEETVGVLECVRGDWMGNCFFLTCIEARGWYLVALLEFQACNT